MMFKIIDKILCGNGNLDDIKTLESIPKMISGSTICALGDAAAMPVESFMKNYKEEFLKYIKDKEEDLYQEKNNNKDLLIFSDFNSEIKKTKEMNSIIKKFEITNSLIVLDKNSKEKIEKSTRNIPNVKVTDVNHFSAFDIVKFKRVVFTETSIKEVEKRYS